MANYSHAGDHNILQNVSPLITFLKLTSLGFIIGVGVVGNLLIAILLIKDKSLQRAPYYFLLDLCVSDVLRSAICFPFVFTSVKNGSAWTYGTLTCKVIAFLGVLSCFHTAFMLFCVNSGKTCVYVLVNRYCGRPLDPTTQERQPKRLDPPLCIGYLLTI
uniref:G protein-coupled receptor 85 n=1 Tax=Paramormyrops kingsleyae TaxID=1676925 RepID=A0A3B3R742_9TELE